jgi:glycosyltransferase involved in cell wall biosynthesis
MILFASAHFPPEPVTAATLCHDLAMAMSEERKVTIITPRPSRPFGFSFEKRIPGNGKYDHLILKSYACPKSTIFGRMMESYSFGKHAADFIKQRHAEIECIYVLAWPLLAQYLIVRASRKYSIPSITHIMDIYPESLINRLPLMKRLIFNFLLPIDKYILQKSTKVITISSGMKNMLAKTRRLENGKVEIVYTWQNDSVFMNHHRISAGSPVNSSFTFMFLGSLSTTAAIEVIISAYHLSGLKNTKLIIAGNGSEKERLIALSRNCGNLTIEFRDAPVLKVPEIQDQADVLILSLKKNTAHFAMPSKLPAYMFSKKPIIACAEGESEIALAIRKANCGWVVPPEDTNSLAHAMMDAISRTKQELLTFGENGFDFALKNYTREKNLHKLVSIIMQAADA